jgi:hypothetical protein
MGAVLIVLVDETIEADLLLEHIRRVGVSAKWQSSRG